MCREGYYIMTWLVQHELVVARVEVYFWKPFRPINVSDNFISCGSNVPFPAYCFIQLPHVHAQPDSSRGFGLGKITNGDTHGVGPCTFSITPAFTSFSNSASTRGHRWKGTRLCHRATGLTDRSMCSFTWTSFKHPSLVNSSGNSNMISSACDWCTFHANGTNPRSSAVWQPNSVLKCPGWHEIWSGRSIFHAWPPLLWPLARELVCCPWMWIILL